MQLTIRWLKFGVLFMIGVVLVSAGLLLPTGSFVLAQGQAYLYMTGVPASVTSPTIFRVDYMLNTNTPFVVGEVWLTFSPTRCLQVVDSSGTPTLHVVSYLQSGWKDNNWDTGFSIYPPVDNNLGTIAYSLYMDTGDPISGTVTVFSLYFKAIAGTPSAFINFVLNTGTVTKTQFIDSEDFQEIELVPTPTNAEFPIYGPPSSIVLSQSTTTNTLPATPTHMVTAAIYDGYPFPSEVNFAVSGGHTYTGTGATNTTSTATTGTANWVYPPPPLPGISTAGVDAIIANVGTTTSNTLSKTWKYGYQITLAPLTSTNTAGKTQTITALVKEPTSPTGMAGVGVNFSVLSGPGSGTTKTATTDSTGTATFQYTVSPFSHGLDKITASVPSLVITPTQDATVQWIRDPSALPSVSDWGIAALIAALAGTGILFLRRTRKREA